MRKHRLFPRSLRECVEQVAEPALAGRGKMQIRLLRDWSVICGPELARLCLPHSLSFPRRSTLDGTLTLAVEPAGALELQHREPWLLERLSAYFGYRAISHIRLIQLPREREQRSATSPENLRRAELLRSLAESLQSGA